MHFFPMDHVEQLVELTSGKLLLAGKAKLTQQEYFQFIGVVLALSLNPNKPMEEMFLHAGAHPFDPSPNLADYMSYYRFCSIMRHLTFSRGSAADRESSFWEVQELIDSFNERRRKVFVCGTWVCGDESMVSYKGKDHRHAQGGCPHVTKIPRKPKGVGMELKNLCCCVTGIMTAI